MSNKETIGEFFEQRFPEKYNPLVENTGQFNVFRKENTVQNPVKYTRRDFYKITLIKGHNLFHYADKTLEVIGDALLFSNPEVPYTFEPVKEEIDGYFCIFKENFLNEFFRKNLHDLPMFRIGGSPAFILNKENSNLISSIFEKMLNENNSQFQYKYELLRNYIMEIIYTALKLKPSEKVYQQTNANSRITAVFLELLERQFPVESSSRRFTMNSAKDFAQQLSVHINHLNRAVKSTTGKTTSEIIYERLVAEAKALLKHTNWDIAEIGYSLGFEDPTHFNHFFKNQTGTKPSDYRA